MVDLRDAGARPGADRADRRQPHHRAAHRGHDLGDQLRLVEQHRAAPQRAPPRPHGWGPADGGRAPEVATGRAARAARTSQSVPYITRRIPYYEVLDEEGLATIEHNADTILEETGIDFRDDPEALRTAFTQAAATADAVITSGGVSVGEADHTKQVMRELGEVLFWKIAMRPGKPLMVGSLGSTHVLGLPGNPVSSMVCGLLFLEPLLAKLGHRPSPDRMTTARLGAPLAANDRRQDYLRARLSRNAAGELQVESFGKQDSSMMNIFAQSDCLIVRPPHAPEMGIGALCPILMLRPFIGQGPISA